jgi:hypothetical protein
MSRLNIVVPATAAVGVVIGFAVFLAMMSNPTPASASNFCVSSFSGVPYHSIQDAIDAADDGDTIRVAEDTYTETLVITEDITVQGGWSLKCTTHLTDDPQFTVIDGGAAGSVVSISGGSTATLDDLTITNGQSQKGGGVHVSGASATLNNMLVTGNVISPTGSTYLEWAYGGGVYVYEGTIALTDCDITYNTSHPDASEICLGGGLALESEALYPAIAVIEGTRIMSNTDPSPFMDRLRGGGLYIDPQSQVTFEGVDNLIAYNEAYGGGGVYTYGDTDLEGVLIRDNYALSGSGGIHVSSGYEGGRIANNYLLYNSTSLGGASISVPQLDMEIANNTIVGDLSGSDAGIYIGTAGGGGLKLTNNIVVNHTIGIEKATGASATLTNNDVWGNTTDYVGLSSGSGDISADPEFVDPGNDDYHLTADSPCVNAGEYVDWLFLDYEGDRRTGTLLDIGADEYGSDYLLFVPAALKVYTP